MRALHLALQSLFVLALAIAPARAQTVGATIPAGSAPAAIAVNPVTNKVYVANEDSNTVTIINGATNFPSTLTVGVRPIWIGVNPETNKIYVSNFGSPPSMMVINGVSGTVSTTLTMGDVGWISINPVTNKIYSLRYGNGDEVNIVLDERYVNTAATRSFTPVSIALNPYTNILYIVHQTTGDLTAIDASVDQSVNPDNAFNYPPLLCPNGTGGYRPSPGPDFHGDNGPCINITDPAVAVTVNPVTNTIYTVSSGTSAQIAVIKGHGQTNPHTATFLTPPGVSGTARAIAVNPVSNKVYAIFDNHVVVVNAGAGNAMTVIPVNGAVAAGINTSTNTIYVPQSNGTLRVINGATNAVTNLSIPSGAKAIAVNPVTNVAYVMGSLGVTPVTGAAGTPATIPLTTSITPFPGDSTTSSGTITLNAASSGGFAAPRKVYFQIDSTTGAWQAASGTGPYTASFSGLSQGSHTIRAFATNALDAPSIVTDLQNNPLVGMVASYTFTVGPLTKADPTISLMSSLNPSTPGQSVTFTASVSGSAGVATGSVNFRDGSTSISGCGAVALSGGSAACTTTTLTAGPHSVTAVYSGDGNYNTVTSAVVTQSVKANAAIALSSSQNPSTTGSSVTFTALLTGSSGVPTGTVNFRDGATSIAGCTAVTVTSGSATCSTASLAAGSHSITAAYSGSATYNAITSAALSQGVGTPPKADASVGMSSSQNPSTTGDSVTFTAIVSGSAGTPTGTITFRESAGTLCPPVALAGGTASCTTSALNTGTHSIVADYSGDASYNGALAETYAQTVNGQQVAPSVVVESSTNPSVPGQSVTFTARVSGSIGTPTGTVDFFDGSTALCPAVPLAAGAAGCTTSTLSGGSHPITARYSGDASYLAATSGALFQGVSDPGARNLSIAQTADLVTASVGKDLVLTLTATNQGPGTATGIVVTDSVTAGATYAWASPGCTLTSGQVTCDIGSIAEGASAQRTVVVRPAASGSITSNAAVSGAQNDAAPSDNTSSLTVGVNPTPAGVAVLRYRLYSDVTKEHHFTTDLNEYTVLGGNGAWVQEGTVGKVLDNPGAFNGVTAVPYYRLYNDFNRWHHWTTDVNEYYTLIQYPGWRGEGVDGYLLPVATTGTTPLYRLLYSDGRGLHHWTIDRNEYDTLIASFGWIGEGIAGHVIE